jgi:biotin operon repressor
MEWQPQMTPAAGILLHYLTSGRESNTIRPDEPITGQALATKLSTTERDIQSLIEELRNEGKPIAIARGGKGYFLALTKDEIQPYLKNVRSRITKLSTTLRNVENAVNGTNQTTLSV